MTESESPPPNAPGNQKTPVSPEVREEIRRLKKHYGTREIAKRVALSRSVVRRVLEEEGMSGPPQPKDRSSLLDPFREQIRAGVESDLRASRILREISEKGYQGGRTILVDFVRKLKAEIAPEKTAKQVKRRFETPIGREMQIDWSVYHLLIAGVLVVVHALGVLLAWSRKLFLGFYRDEREATLLEGMAEAIEYFGGAAARGVVDNMATAVLGRIGPDRKPIWNQRFIEFCKYYGFDAFACEVKDPDRKGKKEKSFRLVEDDLLKGSSFASWDDLLARRWEWLDGKEGVANNRVHGTTGRVPNEAWLEEKPFLVALPRARFPVFRLESRIVDNDATVGVNGCRYTVPAVLAPGVVAVRRYAHHFEVLDRAGDVRFTARYLEPDDKRRLILDPTHYASLGRRAPSRSAGSRFEDAFVARFPDLAPLACGLKARMKALAVIHLRELVRLAERFGEAAFLAAAKRTQDYRRYDAGAVRRILEREHPIAPGEVAIEPLAYGTGPVVLGEVEPCSLDAYGPLDKIAKTTKKEESHGS